MLKKLYQMFFGDEMEIRERLFRIILVVGTAAVTLAIFQGLTLVNASNLMWTYIIMFVAFVIAFVATFKYRKIDFSSVLIGIVIIFIALPIIFFKGGGINSGSAIWMTLGLFYIFMMFRGKIRIFFLIATTLLDAGCYVYAYFNPEVIDELATRFEVHFDSFFAVIVVGFTIGIILEFQIKVFERERRINMEQKAELEAISKSKDNFFASMSHEIRTPINSIVGLNELILREEPSEEIQDYAKNIKNASKMLLALVNDILDLSQLEIKRMQLVDEEYVTYDFFHEVIDMMQVRMEEKGLSFLVDVDGNLPTKMKGDQRRLKQIVLNILSNAVKYTKEGSVTLTAGHEVMSDGRANLIITVADTGIGIRKEDMNTLFDAFMRFDTDKNRKIEGTGLGLSITKQLLDLMGGKISVDSIYTQGSLFTISVPQEIVDDNVMGDFLAATKDNKVGAYYSKAFEAPEARVLVVDDDDLNLIITTKLLQDTKMSVDTASSVEDCLRKTKRRYYNLIFMDYMMPDMDGGQLLREVRKQENGLCKDTPVVLLSANIYGDKQVEYMHMGFDGLLEKPIDAKKLEEEALKFIPEELIEYRRDAQETGRTEGFVSRLLTKKRKRIYITSDSICDLPNEFQEKYDIKIIDLYVKTEHGRFRDDKEIDVDNMSLYLSDTESQAYSLSARVEEYEQFFAEVLTEADEVIYFSMASKAGKCYGNAVEAAKGFAHVHIVDTGNISCGQGLLVLMAAKMAQDGATVAQIFEAAEYWKHKVDASYIIPKTTILYQKGFTDRFTAWFCDRFELHPVLGPKAGTIGILGIRAGKMEHVWKKYIRAHLRKPSKIDDQVVFIAYAGLSARQQQIVLDEVNKCMKFKKIIFTSASASTVCNAGLGSIGIGVFHK